VLLNGSGSENVAVGHLAQSLSASGARNTSLGANTLVSNLTSADLVAVGHSSMNAFTGSQSVAIGVSTLEQAATAASTSVAIGYQSQRVSQGVNTSVGFQTFAANTGGDSGVAVGVSALAANTTGFGNTAVGHQSLRSNTTGGFNVSVGRLALGTGSAVAAMNNNVAVGYNAGFGFTAAVQNTMLGASALFTTTTGTNNTALGYAAGNFVTSGTNNTFVGAQTQTLGLAVLSETVIVGALATTSAARNNVIGYAGTNRIEQTTTLRGPLLVRRDNGEAAGAESLIYSAGEVVILSKEVALTTTGTQTVSIPAGARFYPNEVGVIAGASDTVSVQPFVRFGNQGDTQAIVASVQTTTVANKYDRQRYTTLVTAAGQTVLTGAVSTAATATTLRGRYYWKGILVED